MLRIVLGFMFLVGLTVAIVGFVYALNSLGATGLYVILTPFVLWLSYGVGDLALHIWKNP